MKRILSILLLLALLVPGYAQRYAVTELSVCCLRSAPDYEAPLETQELMGVVVEIIGESGYWRKVSDPQPYIAWCTNKGLVEMSAEEIEDYNMAPKYIVTAMNSRVYSDADECSLPVSDLVMGDLLRKVSGPRYCGRPVKPYAKNGFLAVRLPSGKMGYVPETDLEDYASWQDSVKATPESLVATAKKFVGIPYLWGGMSTKGFDCSGLVRTVYLMNGIALPRNASQMVELGEEVPLDALEAGDLLFFGRTIPGADGTPKSKVTHVGMYIGDGQFIHASHLVRINSMDPSDPDCYENITKLLQARKILLPLPR